MIIASIAISPTCFYALPVPVSDIYTFATLLAAIRFEGARSMGAGEFAKWSTRLEREFAALAKAEART